MSLNKKNSNFIIHFIGIGGIGMSGIAELMLDQGYIIQGSDLVFNNTIKRLKDRGVKICLLYTSPSPRDGLLSRMPSSA